MFAHSKANSAPSGIENQDDLRITVTELPDTIFSSVIDAYSRRSFERGYEVAVTELIASLLPATEVFLRERADAPADVRDALYSFERFLARRLDTSMRADHWVEGGGGI